MCIVPAVAGLGNVGDPRGVFERCDGASAAASGDRGGRRARNRSAHQKSCGNMPPRTRPRLLQRSRAAVARSLRRPGPGIVVEAAVARSWRSRSGRCLTALQAPVGVRCANAFRRFERVADASALNDLLSALDDPVAAGAFRRWSLFGPRGQRCPALFAELGVAAAVPAGNPLAQ